MITPLLEKLIHEGKAKAGTFVFGASGVGTIPVPENEFIIIHHFDYWHFLDEPANTAAVRPASTFIFVFAGNVDVQYAVNGLPIVPTVTTFDPTDVPTTLLLFQAALDADFGAGNYIVTLMTFNAFGNEWTVTVAGIPGASLNGVSPVVTLNVPAVPIVTPFVGGVDAFITTADIMKHSEHIIEFRSNKSRNHYAIREWVVINRTLQQDATSPSGIINVDNINTAGYYSKDCYLVHTDNVQVDIWRVPQPGEWSIPFGLEFLPHRSQEFRSPVGYGITGTVNAAPAVREVFFDGALLIDQYLPLTNLRDDKATPAALGYKEQFRPDMKLGRELSNPQAANDAFTNNRRYPLVNVDYISMNKNYAKELMSSL